jgi:hypothetical protein
MGVSDDGYSFCTVYQYDLLLLACLLSQHLKYLPAYALAISRHFRAFDVLHSTTSGLEHMPSYVTCSCPLGGACTCLRDVAPHALPHHPSKLLSLILHPITRVHVPYPLDYLKENRSRPYKLQTAFLQVLTRSKTAPLQFLRGPRTYLLHSLNTSYYGPHDVDYIPLGSRVHNP